MDFLKSISKDEVDKVRKMLQSGVDVNSSFVWNSKDTFSPVLPNNRSSDHLQTDQEYQCKPLNIAVLGGHPNMVRLLLSAGADINNKDGRGRTALVCAIYGLDLDASNINTSNLPLISQTNPCHFEIMKNILLCHPNLYYATLDSPQYEIKGITPLCLASYLGKADIIQLLLDDGRVNVDGTDSKNATALMYAARDGNIPIVKMLLDYHASPDITDSHGWSAIQYAERNPEIVQLCEQVLRNKRSESVMTPTKYQTNYTRLSHLLSTIPNYPSSLSHLQFETLKDIDHLDPTARPLVNIIQQAFLQAIKIHDHLSLQTLLLQSPPIHGKQCAGPLLINHHDPKTGLTAFHHAMRTKPLPSLDTITMLYQAGADMNAQTYYGRTALHHLARFGLDKDGQSWGIQKSNTSQPNQNRIKGVQVPQHLAMCASLLIRFGSLVNIADPTGNTPLHFAAEFGAVPEVLEVLILEGGADFGLQNKKGLTPLDVCKSDEIRKKMLSLESQRKKSSRSKSVISNSSGTIRPFDSASEYNRSSIVRSSSRSFLFQPETKKQVILQQKKQLEGNQEMADFDVILKAFFSYQTTFTDSIESSLAYITDSILGSWHVTGQDAQQQLENTISQLRFELREAHEMFDSTDQLVDKVMMSFRDELEQVEQVHQADWEMSELQHDKIEKLFDVFERIDGRFCQLELAQDDLISQIEKLRKAAASKKYFEETKEDIGTCVVHLAQSLLILQTVPMVMHLRDDRNRLYLDMTAVVDQVNSKLNTRLALETDTKRITILKESQTLLQTRWITVKGLLTKEDAPALTRSTSHPNTFQPTPKKPKLIFSSEPSLNQLELSFDILHSNLYEIQKDIQDVTDNLERLLDSKKKMYELCLSLEKEMKDNKSGKRTQQEITDELNGVLLFTQQVLEKQKALDEERAQLLKEYNSIDQQLQETKQALQKVRPPALLQGLLERLDTNEVPCIRVEKDWKEDINLVTEVIEDPNGSGNSDSSSSCSSVEITDELTVLQQRQLHSQCTSKLTTLCYVSRLDASLYCLKVLASHAISQSRQQLLQVQVALGQASTNLDETRTQMTQLYDDAAEVARQVFALKTELETIVRHRKEEVVKVWEVVDEVSAGVDTKAIHCQDKSSTALDALATSNTQQKERVEEQDRHQWIIRELEQLQHVYESLQDAIDGLKQEQAMIGQSLRQLASAYIEPQVDKLVGQDENSLLSVSDRLAELMERVRDSELGLRPVSIWQGSTDQLMQMKEEKTTTTTTTTTTTRAITTGTGPRITNRSSAASLHRLSRISAATNRLSINTMTSKSSYTKSIETKRLSIVSPGVSPSVRDKGRMSFISATSLSSLSSYQQEKMLARASNLSSVLSKAKDSNKLSTRI